MRMSSTGLGAKSFEQVDFAERKTVRFPPKSRRSSGQRGRENFEFYISTPIDAKRAFTCPKESST